MTPFYYGMDIKKIEIASNTVIHDLDSLLVALKKRVDYFLPHGSSGGRASARSRIWGRRGCCSRRPTSHHGMYSILIYCQERAYELITHPTFVFSCGCFWDVCMCSEV
jgi:hypothetical protein